MFLAIQIANHSAFQSFQAGVDMVAGKSHLEVRAADGQLDENLFPQIKATTGVKAATPVGEGFVTLPDFPGEYLRILGVDLFTNSEFQTASLVAVDANPAAWLTQPFTLSLPRSLADQFEVAPGDPLRVELDGRTESLTVAFVVADPPGAAGSARTAAMDIGWHQELFGTAGQLASIQIILDDPKQTDAAKGSLGEFLPPGTSATAPAGRSEQIGLMLRGFQLNITALSMVSILVGMFLIYNTTSASVVRRRREIGTLRALGATRRYVKWMFLREALLYGVAGVALGVVGGILLARGLLGAVSETISAHYVLMSIDRAYLSPFAISVSVIYGFAAVLAGAYLPAREASHLDPAAALRPGATSSKGPAINTRLPFLLGSVLILLSVVSAYAALNGGPAPLAFAACFFLIVGFALAVPLISDKLAALVAWVADKAGALLPGIAARSYRRSLHRTAVTTGALMVSVAMMVGVSAMISSFRGTIDQWVSMAMKADMFVAPAANEIIGLKSYTPTEVHDFLTSHPQVRQVDTYLELPIEVGDGAIYALAVISGGTNGNFSFVGGGDERAIDTFFQPDHVILSEPLSAKLGLGRGDTLTIPTPAGDTVFTVAGVYYDYSDDNGRIIISRDNFDRRWDEPRYHSLAIYLKDGADTTPVIAELRTQHSTGGELAIYTNRSIRERIFEIFDQTFAVTYVLRSIAIIVAALGIALTLATLVSERTREIGVMRAVGAARRQIGGAYLGEAALIGLLGTISGIVCGIFLSMLLTWVVNRAFFGWTIQFSVPWGELALTPLWTVPVALLAGLFPAARAGKIEISKAVRME